jgi:hypothetical protein
MTNREKACAAYAKWFAAHHNDPEYREKRRAIQRKARQRNKSLYYSFKRSWEKKNPVKHAAHLALTHAVEHGKIIRPGHCSRCGVICAPQAHHPDYLKPLDVIWLCRPCHDLIHAAFAQAKKG